MKEDQLIQVTLRAEGPGPETAVRLRRWIKGALRIAGLRCVDVRPLAAPGGPQGPPDGASRAVSHLDEFAPPQGPQRNVEGNPE